jgi:biotin operon repressor
LFSSAALWKAVVALKKEGKEVYFREEKGQEIEEEKEIA